MKKTVFLCRNSIFTMLVETFTVIFINYQKGIFFPNVFVTWVLCKDLMHIKESISPYYLINRVLHNQIFTHEGLLLFVVLRKFWYKLQLNKQLISKIFLNTITPLNFSLLIWHDQGLLLLEICSKTLCWLADRHTNLYYRCGFY